MLKGDDMRLGSMAICSICKLHRGSGNHTKCSARLKALAIERDKGRKKPKRFLVPNKLVKLGEVYG